MGQKWQSEKARMNGELVKPNRLNRIYKNQMCATVSTNDSMLYRTAVSQPNYSDDRYSCLLVVSCWQLGRRWTTRWTYPEKGKVDISPPARSNSLNWVGVEIFVGWTSIYINIGFFLVKNDSQFFIRSNSGYCCTKRIKQNFDSICLVFSSTIWLP